MGGLVILGLIIFAPVILFGAYILVHTLVSTVKDSLFPDRPEWARDLARLPPKKQPACKGNGSSRTEGANFIKAGSETSWSAQPASSTATDRLYEQMADQRQEAEYERRQQDDHERWQREEDERRRQQEEDGRRYWEQRAEDDRRYHEDQRRQQDDDYYRRQRDGY